MRGLTHVIDQPHQPTDGLLGLLDDPERVAVEHGAELLVRLAREDVPQRIDRADAQLLQIPANDRVVQQVPRAVLEHRAAMAPLHPGIAVRNQPHDARRDLLLLNRLLDLALEFLLPSGKVILELPAHLLVDLGSPLFVG